MASIYNDEVLVEATRQNWMKLNLTLTLLGDSTLGADQVVCTAKSREEQYLCEFHETTPITRTPS